MASNLRSVSSLSSFSNSNRFSPLNPFRPSLRFAKNLFINPKSLFPPLVSAKPRNLNTQIRHSCRFFNPVPHLSKGSPSDRCFRCGARGHFVKQCKIQIRCYLCGCYGHKSKRCYKKWRPRFHPRLKAATHDSEARVVGSEDLTWVLRASGSDPDLRIDPMMLDPSVANLSTISDLEPATFWVSNPFGSEEVSEEDTDVDNITVRDKEAVDVYIHDSEFRFREASRDPSGIVDPVLKKAEGIGSLLGGSSILDALPGMGKGIGAPVAASFGRRTKVYRMNSKGLRLPLAGKPGNILSMMGLGGALRSFKSSFEVEMPADPPTFSEPRPSPKEPVMEAVFSFYDEGDLSSDEEHSITNSVPLKQLELNLEATSLEGLLDIEVTDGFSDIVSPLKPAPVQTKLSPFRVQSRPKKSKRAINLEPPAAVRRSPRLSKVAI